jgi:protein TonB
MASPEKIAPLLPETLPEDFTDWDSEASPMPVLGNSGEWEASEDAHSFGETPKPLGQSADYNAILGSLLDRPRASVSASPAPVFVKQQKNFIDWDSGESPTAPPVNRSEWEAWEAGHSYGRSPKPLGQSADRNAILEALIDMPRVSGSASSAPVFVKQQRDFIDWDSEVPPTATPVNRIERESGHSFGETPKPLGQSADYNVVLESLLDRPSVSSSASPAPVSLKPQKLTSELVDVSPSHASHTPDASRTTNEVPVVASLPNAASVDGMSNSPELAATLRREADEVLFGMFQPKNIEVKGKPKNIEVKGKSKNIEVKAKPKAARKKWMTVSAMCASGILLLLILMTPLFHHGTQSAAKQSVQPHPGASYTQLKTNTPAPSASEPLTQDEPPTTTNRQKTTDNHPTKEVEGVNLTQVQARMMNDQLTAPTQIPQDIKKPVADNGPPPASFGAAGADGLGGNGAIDRVFNGHAQPVTKVAPLKPLAISSGVAAGMLIQQTPAVYPPIAKSARVSGTVELHAIISKNGTIKDLHVVSGPAMLRQAAVDAVRTWRYKPYQLNNEPTEVETTINVIFTLGG